MIPSRKVALVTGSATGVGRACAVRFAKLGFAVVVNYSKSEADARETVKLVEAEGARRCNKTTVADGVQVKGRWWHRDDLRSAQRAREQRRYDALCRARISTR